MQYYEDWIMDEVEQDAFWQDVNGQVDEAKLEGSEKIGTPYGDFTEEQLKNNGSVIL